MAGESGAFRFTSYFELSVLRRRPYLTQEICIRVVEQPDRVETQENGRIRFWAIVEELDGRAIRVVTLPDGRTIHNAFPDRGFRP